MPVYRAPSRKTPRDMSQYARLSAHYRGVTVLREDGVWSQVENPSQERMDAAERCYRGGYTYQLTTSQFNEIPSAYGGGGA